MKNHKWRPQIALLSEQAAAAHCVVYERNNKHLPIASFLYPVHLRKTLSLIVLRRSPPLHNKIRECLTPAESQVAKKRPTRPCGRRVAVVWPGRLSRNARTKRYFRHRRCLPDGRHHGGSWPRAAPKINIKTKNKVRGMLTFFFCVETRLMLKANSISWVSRVGRSYTLFSVSSEYDKTGRRKSYKLQVGNFACGQRHCVIEQLEIVLTSQYIVSKKPNGCPGRDGELTN